MLQYPGLNLLLGHEIWCWKVLEHEKNDGGARISKFLRLILFCDVIGPKFPLKFTYLKKNTQNSFHLILLMIFLAKITKGQIAYKIMH